MRLETAYITGEWGHGFRALSRAARGVFGEVVAVNEALQNQPELVNDDPYGDGWMLEVEPNDPDEFDALLSAEEYEEQIA